MKVKAAYYDVDREADYFDFTGLEVERKVDKRMLAAVSEKKREVADFNTRVANYQTDSD